ncbi:MAG: hypothetical protein PVI30_25030 [Myxococcales bacterium]
MGGLDIHVEAFDGSLEWAAGRLQERFGLSTAVAELVVLSTPCVLVSALPSQWLADYEQALRDCGCRYQVIESRDPAREPGTEVPSLRPGEALELPRPRAGRAPGRAVTTLIEGPRKPAHQPTGASTVPAPQWSASGRPADLPPASESDPPGAGNNEPPPTASWRPPFVARKVSTAVKRAVAREGQEHVARAVSAPPPDAPDAPDAEMRELAERVREARQRRDAAQRGRPRPPRRDDGPDED